MLLNCKKLSPLVVAVILLLSGCGASVDPNETFMGDTRETKPNNAQLSSRSASNPSNSPNSAKAQAANDTIVKEPTHLDDSINQSNNVSAPEVSETKPQAEPLTRSEQPLLIIPQNKPTPAATAAKQPKQAQTDSAQPEVAAQAPTGIKPKAALDEAIDKSVSEAVKVMTKAAEDTAKNTSKAADTDALENATTGSVRLGWSTEFDNAQSIESYEIIYGQTPETMSQSLAIQANEQSEFIIKDLPAGNYYFALRAIAQDGSSSAYSTAVNATI